MTLYVDIDIKGTLITVPAVNVTQTVSQYDLKTFDYAESNFWRTPDNLALMLKPIQYYQQWPTTSVYKKLKLSDYNCDPTAWEQQERRGTGDYFLHSTSGAALPLISKFSLPANTGLFVESWFYSKPDNMNANVFDMQFGSFFTLWITANGDVTLSDIRIKGANKIVATGNISKGQSVVGKFVTLSILPYRQEYLMINSNLGGYFVANVGSTTDPKGNHIITPPAPVVFYSLSSPTNAAIAFSPLQYDSSRTLSIPEQTLTSSISIAPTFKQKSDVEFGTTCTITPSKTIDSTHPSNKIGYSLSLTPAAGTISGTSSVTFKSLYTPFVYCATIQSERQLGTTAYSSNTISKILRYTYTQNQEQLSNSFRFTIDNNNDAWTSLKDIQNRRMTAYIDAIDESDPDYDIVTANDGPITIFEGYTEPIVFTDGRRSEVEIECIGLVKALRINQLSSEQDFDGIAHTEAIRTLLKQCSFVDIGDVSGDFPTPNIFIYDDGINMPLPPGGSGTEPAWRPADGQSVEAFINEICNFTGWTLFEGRSIDNVQTLYYVPHDWEYSILQNAFGTINISQFSTTRIEAGFVPSNGSLGITTQTKPNSEVTYIAATSINQHLSEALANDVWVVGFSDDGDAIVAHYEDHDSIYNRASLRYLGARSKLVIVNPSLTTQDAVLTVCTTVAQDVIYPKRRVEFVLPDFRSEIYINSAVHIEGYGDGKITAIETSVGYSDRFRETRYVALLNN